MAAGSPGRNLGILVTMDVANDAEKVVAAWLSPLELAVLGAIWGASFLFMRIAAADFGPFALVEVRLALGASILTPFLWRERANFTRKSIARLAGIGLINSAIPFVLFAWGAERAPAGIGAITNAMTVMFAALVAFLFYGEPIGRWRLIGLIGGFIGVIVLATDRTSGEGILAAALAGTAAAACYGFAINLVRRYLTGVSASAVASATLLSASLLVLPFAIATWPSHPLPGRAWLSAILLGILCTGAAFVLYYRLINRIGGARAATVTYLIPLFSVLWAWIFLGETLTARMALAGGLILGGVALSQRQRR
jgi:drug/metabolite transporter (DMT)-like permease